ncbi:MAG TPA: isochorismatase family cysteine hydrolase [Vicinamibacterales bacterium]
MSAALLVIDMQNSFCHPDGAMHNVRGPVIGARELISATARAVDAARAAGHLIVYTRHGYHAEYLDADSRFRRELAEVVERGGLVRGTWDTEVIAELPVADEDVIVDKTRFNAFHGTPLQLILARHDIRELFVAGVLTNVCVESTVRTARELDYEVTVLADCVSTRSAQLHAGSLASMREGHFARVVPWQQALGA